MKLIAGSILTGLSLLSLTFGHIKVAEGSIEKKWPEYSIYLDTPIEVLIIIVMIAGISLMVWGILEQKKAKKDGK